MKGIGWRINIKFRMKMFDTYVQVTDGVKELILFGANQRVEKCQKCPLYALFYLSGPQQSSITTKTGTESENYHTCVNLLVKFCHALYSKN